MPVYFGTILGLFLAAPKGGSKQMVFKMASSFRQSPSVTFGVSFFAVFLGYSLCTKQEEFYCLQGRSEGLLQENDTCFPSRCSRHTPTKNDTLKMTLGRARSLSLKNWHFGTRLFWYPFGFLQDTNTVTTSWTMVHVLSRVRACL